MGCKFSFKRVFLVASLCLAGLFGVSSVIVNEQVKETPVVEEAKAADPEIPDITPFDTIYITISANWNKNNDGSWKDTYICFYKSYHKDHFSDSSTIAGNVSYPGYKLSPFVGDDGNYYASISVPSGAYAMVVNNGSVSSINWNARTFVQHLQDKADGLNLFDIDEINTLGTDRQKGYWTHYAHNVASKICIDRKLSDYTGSNSLKIAFCKTRDVGGDGAYGSDWAQIGSDVSISFASGCYGGTEYSDCYEVTAKATYFYIKNGSSAVTDLILIPTDYNSTYHWNSVDDDCYWTTGLPSLLNLVVDIRVTSFWYDGSAPDYTSITFNVEFKDSGKTQIGNDTALSPVTIDGVVYGTVIMPFGTEVVCLRKSNWSRSCYYSQDCSDLLAVGGEDYVFIRTTSNDTDTSMFVGHEQTIERGNPDGYYLYGSFNQWSEIDGMIKLTSNGEGGYYANGVDISASTILKPIKIENNAATIYYKYHEHFTPLPALYPLSREAGDYGNFVIGTAANYNLTVYNLYSYNYDDHCGLSIEPTDISIQYTINDGEKHNMSRTGTNENGYLAIYSSTSAIRPNVGDVVKFYVNNTLMSTTYAEAGSNALSGSGNNISVNTDLLADQTLIFETKGTRASPEYVAYLGGYRARRTSSYTGIESNTAFYIKDSTSNGWWSGTSYTWIRFYDPIHGYEDTLDE